MDLYLQKKVLETWSNILNAAGIYLKVVWSKFNNRFDGILSSSTSETTWCRCKSSHSCLAPSGMSPLLVVDIRFRKPILWNRLFVHNKESRSTWLKFSWGFRTISSFAVAKQQLMQRDHLFFKLLKYIFAIFHPNFPLKVFYPLGKRVSF